LADFLTDRIPFAEAITDKKLLQLAWRMLSTPQQVVVKAFYGLELNAEELDLWSAFQGGGEHDQLGYLQHITAPVPYVAKEYEILTGIIGRRSGKSDRIGGFIAAYEVCLGGHTQYVREGQDVFWLYIAQDLPTAELNMKFVAMALKMSPLLSKYILKDKIEEIPLKNGITIRPEPPNIRTGRGAAVVGVTMDEFGFWYKDSKSANPDFEVVRALEYSLSQFPNSKQVRLSTPWTREGLLFLASQHGTEGRELRCEECSSGHCPHMDEDREDYEGHLVVKAPTAMMGNPLMTRRRLQRLWKRDREAFRRESLAQFVDTQTSFLPWTAVERAIDRKQTERAKLASIDYLAAIDPAFRHDSFALAIVHHERTRGVVQDFSQEWTPEPGEKLNPAIVLTQVGEILTRWGIDYTWSDQYHLESLQALADDRGFAIIGQDLSSKTKPRIMSDLASLLNQGKMRLLDIPNQETQLKQLQKTLGPTGYVSISGPPGKRDDLALVLALAASKALMMPPHESQTAKKTPGGVKLTDATLAKLRTKWAERQDNDPEWAKQMENMQFLLDAYGDPS